MIRIENANVYGFEAAVRGARNPMNSWAKSDSKVVYAGIDETPVYGVGAADMELMKKLVRAGADHSKFMRMITVSCDITAPLYWWKEMDTYKVGTVRNSCSTMHTIHKKPFELDDFSHEHCAGYINGVCDTLNGWRNQYLETNDKKYWYAMIQLLPSSYNQRATWQANYAVLRNIYFARRNHKLDEWHDFCKWIESLPYSELITEVQNDKAD